MSQSKMISPEEWARKWEEKWLKDAPPAKVAQGVEKLKQEIQADHEGMIKSIKGAWETYNDPEADDMQRKAALLMLDVLINLL